MTVKDIISGESEYLEFKQEVPKKSEIYMKTVVAFANGSGGKSVFGVEDNTCQVVGIHQEEAFSIMDGITSAICDSCTPMIVPIVTLASVEEKVVIVVNIMPGSQRPYYLTTKGKENGTYIRVSGTTRPADSFVLKELEFEGANRCFDQNYAAPEASVTEDEISHFCNKMYQYAAEHCRTEEAVERIRPLTKQKRKSTDKVRKSTDNITDNHKKIIQYVEERGAITNKEVRNLLNVKDSRALKILKELVAAGVLHKEGKLKGSYYKLK